MSSNEKRPPGLPRTQDIDLPDLPSPPSESDSKRDYNSKRDTAYKKQWKLVVGHKLVDGFPLTRLPTNQLVMQRYYTMKLDHPVATPISLLASKIYAELKVVWDRAFIPTVSEKACVARIRTLLNSWDKKDCRKLKEGSQKLESYQQMLQQLCDLGPPEDEVLHILRAQRHQSWEEDYKFYQNMKFVPQVGCMGSQDMHLAKTMENSEQRVRKAEKRKMKEEDRMASETAEQQQDLDDADDMTDVVSRDGQDPTYVPSRRQLYNMSRRPDTVLLELPTYDIAKASSVLTARLEMSDRAVLTLFAKIIQLGKGNVHDFILSRSSVWRQRITGEKEAADQVFHKFKSLLESTDEHIILQWDGKKVAYSSGEIHDRLCILLHTLPSGRTQFVGAPRMPDGTGAAQCEACIRYADLWNVQSNVIGMIWDTTASNTGRVKGSALLFEEAVGHAILWIACRHHVAELHVHWVDEIIRGVAKGLSLWIFC